MDKKIQLKIQRALEVNSNEKDNALTLTLKTELEQEKKENEGLITTVQDTASKIRSVFILLKNFDKKLDIIANYIKGFGKKSRKKEEEGYYSDYIELKNIEFWNAIESKY